MCCFINPFRKKKSGRNSGGDTDSARRGAHNGKMHTNGFFEKIDAFDHLVIIIAALKCFVFFYLRFANQILHFSTTLLKIEDISELISI